jgi:hypothetical protein
MTNLKKGAAVVAVALLLVGALLWSMNTAQAANPGPLAAPTPVSVSAAAAAAGEAVLFSGSVITQDTYSARVPVAAFQRTDIQHVFDQTVVAGAPNTTTLTIQFSNDGANWTDGAALASANAVDAALLQQVAVFGKYARVFADVSNTNPVTVTVIGVLK